jgi:mono/diheme cytochrome c family protein
MKGLFTFFSSRAKQPIETRDYGRLYLLLSGLLFIGTMWSVIDEVSTRRPWKDTQEQYFNLSQQKWTDKLKEAEASLDSAAYAQLTNDLKAAEAKLTTPEVVGLLTEINQLEEELLDANRDYTFAKSRNDETYYLWKKSLHEGKEDAGYKQKVQDLLAQMAKFNARVEVLTAKHDSIMAIVTGYRNSVKEVRAKIKDLYAPIELAKSKIEKAKTSPILIKQVMMNNFDRSNFGTPKARIDRCQTCHTGWKDDMMEDAQQPFAKHPVAELLKIHNPETFGCTPCHHGQGAALTAGFAHGDKDHYWEWPLLKGKEVYASCNSCHANQMFMKYGDRFNKAKQMLSEAGCFGCHEIKGFTDMAKIGPELNQLLAKEKPDWTFRWVRNPKDYNPHTRMPNFRFNDDQAEAITAYLSNVAKQSSYHPQKGISTGGNATHGKEIVETVGCKGCHVIGDDTRMRDVRGFSYDVAPELTRAGSKLDPDWVYEWIKNPRQYRPNTRMPSLRLSDQEARDIVAYLMTMKDERKIEQKSLTLDDAQLIKRGDKLIREYGCSGCHQINGMEKEGRVSVALSNIGRKRVDEFDFGDTKVTHTWNDWIFGKIKDARQYTTDRIISKMPVFAFADSEIITLRTLLRGMTKEAPEEMYRQPYDKTVQAVEAGRRLTGYYNCINCHKIEEIGGSIKAVLDDEAMAPPYLYPEGAKVQEPWLHDFLKGPSTIRPWLKIRMPTFSLNDSEITTISKYFLALHKKELELRDYKSYLPDVKYVNVGHKLFQDLQCLSCHYTGKIPEGKTPGDLAPNLAMAKSRLKPEWIVDWIINPDLVSPGTKMPQFYPDIKEPSPFSQDFNADAREQIKALRDYVLTIPAGSK